MFSGHVFECDRLRVGPGHEVVEFAGEMAVDDLREDVGHIGLRIDAVDLAGLDERGDDRPVLSPAVRAGEESVLPIEGNGADGALDDVRVDLDAPVVDEARQAVPARERVADRLGELGLLADQRELFTQPWLEGVEDGAGFFLSRRAPVIRVLTPDIALDGVEGADARQRRTTGATRSLMKPKCSSPRR